MSLEALLTSFNLSQKKDQAQTPPLSHGRMAKLRTQHAVRNQLSELEPV